MKRLLALMLVTLSLTAQAAPPAHVEEHVPAARLAGQGGFTWFGLSVYDAELWVGEKGYGAELPYVLELRYARNLDGKKIADASVDEMKKMGAGSETQRAQWGARMREIFPDVKKGTRLAGVYLPGAGARFYLDGKALATVPDPEFAKAFFGIWLDPRTTAPALRTSLLRNAGPR